MYIYIYVCGLYIFLEEIECYCGIMLSGARALLFTARGLWREHATLLRELFLSRAIKISFDAIGGDVWGEGAGYYWSVEYGSGKVFHTRVQISRFGCL